MRILIDIGHPAHVHYFKNVIKILQEKGDDFLIIARDKEVTFQLLNHYKIPFVSRGKGSNSFLGKLFYILKADWIIFKEALKFKPDLFLSFASPYAAHASKLVFKKHFTIDDTEHAKFEIILYKPFTDIILTPYWYSKNRGKKQIRFNSFVEFFHLHKKYFQPDQSVLNELGISENEKYVILRFISWEASHDFGINGITLQEKLDLINKLSSKFRVFISSEKSLPTQLEKNRLKISPHRLHDALYFSSLYIGEGGTTATECAIMGVPNILINTLAKKVGVHKELKSTYNVQLFFDNIQDAMPSIDEIINSKHYSIKEKSKILNEKSKDITEGLIWLINNHKLSRSTLKKHKDFKTYLI
jgi:predicted glycosyltransferase